MSTVNRSLDQAKITCQGSMDHVLEILASHKHPVILVGNSAQRWMGSAGMMDVSCDLLVRDSAIASVATDLVESGHWKYESSVSKTPRERFPCTDREQDANIVLRRTRTEHESEYQYLNFWPETTYHIGVDGCPFVEVPDVYPWTPVLIEEKWHPSIGREDGWWFGPHLLPDTNMLNLPEGATLPTLFPKGAPRGKSPSNPHQIFVPTIPAYIDALVYHVTHYKLSKPGLATLASLEIRNLTRYLYLELPHQHLQLLIELEECDFMDDYLQKYKRKPSVVYKKTPGGRLEAKRVREWDPTSYQD